MDRNLNPMDEDSLLRELKYKAVRSGGAGGQHVNKVATKVILSFDLDESTALSEMEKQRLFIKLRGRLSQKSILQLSSDSARSQHRNKELVTKRFIALLRDSLKVPKKRRRTKPSVKAIKKRLAAKKKLSEKKAGRKKPPLE